MYFSWGTGFHCVQRKAFIATANVFYRWYPVLPISQPSEIAYRAGVLPGVAFRWSWVKKIPILSDSEIDNSHMIN